MTVQVGVSNEGDVALGELSLDVYLTPPGQTPPLRIRLWRRRPCPALAVGNQTSRSIDVTVPSSLPDGTYALWAWADRNNATGQAAGDRTDDRRETSLTVTTGASEPRAFVYRAEFNPGRSGPTLPPSSSPVVIDPTRHIALIPGRDLIVRYYLLGNGGRGERVYRRARSRH